MNEAEAQAILVKLNDELTDTVTGRLAAEKREASLRKLIDGYLELFPDLDQSHDLHVPDPGNVLPFEPPRGKEAVRQIMQERPGKWYTVGAMTHVLQRRGWLPVSSEPENAIRAALERLREEGDPPYCKSRGASGSVTYSYRPFEMHDQVHEHGGFA